MVAPKRNVSAVITLFFVAPLVAEYLLGDLPLRMLTALIVLAPAYGGAAVLIREITRRTGRGWPTMLTLGAAYALIGEGLITQSLFNPDYMKKHLHLLDPAYIPALGIGGWWTVFMFNVHTFWSVGVSIALVEAQFPADAETPWLGWVGDSVVGFFFVLGSVASFGIGFMQNRFIASHAQLLGATVLSVLLVASAFVISARRSRASDGGAPSPWVTGAIAFVLGMSVLKAMPIASVLSASILHASLNWGWPALIAMLIFDALFLVLVAFFSRQSRWSAMHTLSLAAGGALAYGIRAFTAKPLFGSVLWMRISNTICLAAVLWLIWLGARRISRYQSLSGANAEDRGNGELAPEMPGSNTPSGIS